MCSVAEMISPGDRFGGSVVEDMVVMVLDRGWIAVSRRVVDQQLCHQLNISSRNEHRTLHTLKSTLMSMRQVIEQVANAKWERFGRQIIQ